jgi:hypothetical protein
LEDSFWLGEDEYRKEKVPLLPKRAKTNQDNTFVKEFSTRFLVGLS